MLLKIFLLFLKLGAISIGGGYTVMGLIYAEASSAVGLTAKEFADLAALELLASGPIAINAATYIGYIKAGIPGALVGTVAIITPSIVFCSIIYYFLNRFENSKLLSSFIGAIKMAAGGLMLSTVFALGKEIFFTSDVMRFTVATPAGNINIAAVGVSALALLALLKFKVGPVKVILGAAVLGMLLL